MKKLLLHQAGLIAFRTKQYAWYLAQGKSSLYIHAPFAFNLVSNVIYDRTAYPDYDTLKKIITAQRADRTRVSFSPVGAMAIAEPVTQEISDLAERLALPVKYARLLYRLIKHFGPRVILETGTGTGISAAAMALGTSEAVVHTIDAVDALVETARRHHKTIGITNIIYHQGRVDDVLPGLATTLAPIDFVYLDANHTYEATLRYFNWLAPHLSPYACVAVDDIHWSPGMKKAWEELTQHPAVTMSMDLFRLGLLFTNGGLNREALRVYF